MSSLGEEDERVWGTRRAFHGITFAKQKLSVWSLFKGLAIIETTQVLTGETVPKFVAG